VRTGLHRNVRSPYMSSQPRPNQPELSVPQACKHPSVRIVAREEDAEFVECVECGDIFESSEFRDMEIEAKLPDTDT
jgi:hypothetical protein